MRTARWHELRRRLARPHHSKSLLARTLTGSAPYSTAYEWLTFALVIASVILALAASVDRVCAERSGLLELADGVISSVFLLDYGARLATAVEHSPYRQLGPLYGRLRWMRSWEASVDAMAALPFFVDVLLPFVALPPLSWLRVFRIARLFSTSHYAAAVSTASRVLFVNREILFVALTLVSFMVFVTSALLFLAGGDEASAAKNGIDSLPGAMYTAVLMLTGLGSPEGELNTALRLVTVLTAFLSVPFFAVPAAMLTWGFEGEAARLATHERRRFRRRQVYGGEAESSSSDEDEADTELAEYLDGVGGGEAAEAEGAEAAALDFFASAAEGTPLLPTAQRLANRLGVRAC